jgi:hypothetical protein
MNHPTRLEVRNIFLLTCAQALFQTTAIMLGTLSAASVASFSAGSLLDAWGWRAVNLSALPMLAVSALALAAYAWHVRSDRAGHAAPVLNAVKPEAGVSA